MSRKLKALGLALFAVLAMGALSISAASAGEFHSEASHTIIKGSQVGEDVFTVNAGTVKCKEATYAGTQNSATATTVKVTPTYSECTAFGFVSATIHTNGCTYEFSGDNNNVVISCPSSPITITAFNCWVTVGSQTNGGVTYENTGSGAWADMHVRVHKKSFKYTQHSKSFPGCSNGTFTNGTWAIDITMQAFHPDGTQVGWRRS